MDRRPAELTDLEAIQAVLAGDADAFRGLVDRYGRSIFNLAYRMTGSAADAEELAQDVFLQAYSKLADFRVGARFHPWLYTIALNICRNHVRRRKLVKWQPLETRRGSDEPVALDPPESAPNPEEALLARENEERLARAVDALPAKYREIFILRQSQGLSYEEIADVTGRPLGTVEVQLFRARNLLLKSLSIAGRPNKTK